MPEPLEVYADFHHTDALGRLRLECAGTAEDLRRQQIELRPGLVLHIYADDLNADGQPDELWVDGVVAFSAEEQCWVAAIDWSAIRHASDATEAERTDDVLHLKAEHPRSANTPR